MRSQKQKTIKGLWRVQTALIINKISIVLLKLLAIVDAQLSLAKKKPDTDMAVFGKLAIVILMENFYQFPPLIRRPLWKKAITTNKLHSKAI